jgi:hypothetical protein
MARITLTHSQFAAHLASLKGCQFINIWTLTEPDMYLKGNPYKGRVQKVSAAQMQFNFAYENAVNNRLIKGGCEGNFEAESLPWGEWLHPNKVIDHKGVLYLRTYNVKGAKPRTFYFVDGHLATPEQYAEFSAYFKPTKSASNKQTEAGLVENQVKVKNYKFSSILRLSMNGNVITLVDDNA